MLDPARQGGKSRTGESRPHRARGLTVCETKWQVTASRHRPNFLADERPVGPPGTQNFRRPSHHAVPMPVGETIPNRYGDNRGTKFSHPFLHLALCQVLSFAIMQLNGSDRTYWGRHCHVGVNHHAGWLPVMQRLKVLKKSGRGILFFGEGSTGYRHCWATPRTSLAGGGFVGTIHHSQEPSPQGCARSRPKALSVFCCRAHAVLCQGHPAGSK